MIYKIQRSFRFDSCTPTNMLIKLPSILEENPFERFIRPVNIANIDDSMFDGIIFANRTIPGSL